MPDLLHPAAPVVPCAPASPVALPTPLALPLRPLLVDVAEPDVPAAVGDRVPCHLFWAPLAEPLPPVLRPDRPYCPTAHAVSLGLLPPDCLPRTGRAPACPPCHGDCRQGRRCPARPVPAIPAPRPSLARSIVGGIALVALLVGGLATVHLLSTIPRP